MADNNPLVLLPAKVRQGIYVAYGIAAIVVGAVDVAYDPNPEWLQVTLRVVAYLAIPVAALAAVNVTPKDNERANGLGNER